MKDSRMETRLGRIEQRLERMESILAGIGSVLWGVSGNPEVSQEAAQKAAKALKERRDAEIKAGLDDRAKRGLGPELTDEEIEESQGAWMA